MYNQNCTCHFKQAELRDTLRKLWEQHVMWTRSFIISTSSNLGDLTFVTNRLLQNPKDFADVLRPIYGRKKANEFAELLTEHLLIAADLVNAAQEGNSQKVDASRKKWYANADEIATFLAAINPRWSKKKWQELLYDHLKMTEDEAISRLTEKYEKNVKQYDEIEDEALKMADYMYFGLQGIL